MPRFLEYFGVPTQVENSAFIEAVKTGDLHKVDQDLRLKKGKSSAIIAKVNKLYRGKHEGVPFMTMPLIVAVHAGEEKMAEFLIENGANVNAHGGYHNGSALHLSTKLGSRNITRTLIRRGANSNDFDQDGKSSLILAIHNGDVGMVKLLLELGADVDRGCVNGRSALDHAVRLSERTPDVAVQIVQALFDKKATVTARELHTACFWGTPTLVDVILKQNGIDVNKPLEGDFALHVAVSAGNDRVVNYLVNEAAVDTTQMDQDGMTALQLSEFLGYVAIQEILQGFTDVT